MPDVTHILERLNRGDQAAYDELVPLVYRELRDRARAYLAAQRRGHTLQATALVHEAFLKLAGGGEGAAASWRDSRHFYNAAAEAMRQILVNHARDRSRLKRGGPQRAASSAQVEELAEDAVAAAGGDAGEPDWEALDLALADLKTRDERRYQVVMLRYFAGLTDARAAEVLGVSEKTVERDWPVARAFLEARMRQISH